MKGGLGARLVTASLAGLCGCAGAAGPERPLLVFAASSLREALLEIGPLYASRGGPPVQFNFAGTQVLVRQIEASSQGDVLLSADEAWMDHLERRGGILPSTRRTLLGNRLVVVANRERLWRLEDLRDLQRLPFRHLAMGDPEAVPAGRYARELLERTPAGAGEGSLWDRLRERVVPARDVRGALALVEADPSIVGIVYATDARTSGRVRVLFEAPAQEPPRIRYSGAVVKGRRDDGAGERWLEFLGGPEAARVFEARGFLVWNEAGHG